MSFSSEKSIQFQQYAGGSWGTFNTPAGEIQYLESKARIRGGSTDPESRLTRYLKPVREALALDQMDFNQLLQRDLDDHRVATDLVPYLMRKDPVGPAFFPPVVAALLPFEEGMPIDNFPDRTAIDVYQSDNGYWSGYQFGEAFKFERLSFKDGDIHDIPLGTLSWNAEKAQLVVIDGQHRAMALLALYRTLNGLWEGAAEKFRHFYEEAIAEEAKRQSKTNEQISDFLRDVELPVNIVWFPAINQEVTSHQKAARKLFVDVNQNARPPSASRVLLLSEDRLSAVFTRCLLNELRNTWRKDVPLAAIEYDNPQRDQASSAKWSAVTNVSILHDCVYRSVFGPAKYIQSMDTKFKGKENRSEGDLFFRTSLAIKDKIPKSVEEGDREIKREDMGEYLFPRTYRSELEERFMETWGDLVIKIIAQVKPYGDHAAALRALDVQWTPSDATTRLAKDAVFEGVGMYWTLRDGYTHWVDRNKARRDRGEPKLDKTYIVQAWEITEAKREEFERFRAKEYLGNDNEKSTKATRDVFAVFETNACQLGLVLAARSLGYLGNVNVEKIPRFVNAVIRSVNAGIGGEKGGRDRRMFLSRNATSPINLIRKLDTPFSVYFRYFWLELMQSKEGWSHLEPLVDNAVMRRMVMEARGHYVALLDQVHEQGIRSVHPDWDRDKRLKEARKSTDKELGKALKHWFQFSAGEAQQALANARHEDGDSGEPKSGHKGDEAEAPGEDGDDELVGGDDGEDFGAGGDEAIGIDDLKKDIDADKD